MIDATNLEWDKLLRDLATVAERNPQFSREINKFVFTLTKGSECGDPACLGCQIKTADEYADFLEAGHTTNH